MRRLGVCIMILALFMAACAGTAPNILNVQGGPMGVIAKQVEINDKYLERNLIFGDVSFKALDAGNAYEAQVSVKNESIKDLAFEYRFIWYDVHTYELPRITSWLPAKLGSKESGMFRSTVPGSNAAGFKFMVRTSQPVTPTGS